MEFAVGKRGNVQWAPVRSGGAGSSDFGSSTASGSCTPRVGAPPSGSGSLLRPPEPHVRNATPRQNRSPRTTSGDGTADRKNSVASFGESTFAPSSRLASSQQSSGFAIASVPSGCSTPSRATSAHSIKSCGTTQGSSVRGAATTALSAECFGSGSCSGGGGLFSESGSAIAVASERQVGARARWSPQRQRLTPNGATSVVPATPRGLSEFGKYFDGFVFGGSAEGRKRAIEASEGGVRHVALLEPSDLDEKAVAFEAALRTLLPAVSAGGSLTWRRVQEACDEEVASFRQLEDNLRKFNVSIFYGEADFLPPCTHAVGVAAVQSSGVASHAVGNVERSSKCVATSPAPAEETSQKSAFAVVSALSASTARAADVATAPQPSPRFNYSIYPAQDLSTNVTHAGAIRICVRNPRGRTVVCVAGRVHVAAPCHTESLTSHDFCLSAARFAEHACSAEASGDAPEHVAVLGNSGRAAEVCALLVAVGARPVWIVDGRLDISIAPELAAALLTAMRQLGIEVVTRCSVKCVERLGDGFAVVAASGDFPRFEGFGSVVCVGSPRPVLPAGVELFGSVSDGLLRVDAAGVAGPRLTASGPCARLDPSVVGQSPAPLLSVSSRPASPSSVGLTAESSAPASPRSVASGWGRRRRKSEGTPGVSSRQGSRVAASTTAGVESPLLAPLLSAHTAAKHTSLAGRGATERDPAEAVVACGVTGRLAGGNAAAGSAASRVLQAGQLRTPGLPSSLVLPSRVEVLWSRPPVGSVGLSVAEARCITRAEPWVRTTRHTVAGGLELTLATVFLGDAEDAPLVGASALGIGAPALLVGLGVAMQARCVRGNVDAVLSSLTP
eukprot:TRINITY_DN67068_c0_g1_i1.p1 TRINITY_DN67068_c0_g1~~TRINITY_DN67068_c0_g1_i1.p1  ORF type:complete len:845 (+),score=133.57 TRINITY_DN67068_c0_g1_i1:84-2618(+)